MTLPSLFVTRMQTLLGDSAADFFAALDTPERFRGLRLNALKGDRAAVLAALPVTLIPAPFAPDGFLTDADMKAGALPLHHAGAIYMQEPSAMSAVTVLRPAPGERVLDLCAAPGSKTTQIAAAMAGHGLLWANEYVPARAKILAQNLERCGVRNAVVSTGDTARIAARLPGFFDAVLVDAPCSGEGMFRKEAAALDQWSVENIALCARRQTDILDNAAATVAPDGRLVFSTCTYAPEENEWSVIRFLQRHPDFSLEDTGVSFGRPGFSVSAVAPFALPEDTRPDTDIPLSRCRRVLPQDGGEGHFVALFTRSGTGEHLTPPAFSAPASPLTAPAEALFHTCFSTAPTGIFAVFGDTVRLLPSELPDTRGLSVLCAGYAVAVFPPDRRHPGKPGNRCEPCHAAFMAARPEDCRRVLALSPDDARLKAFLRGEEIAAPEAEPGYTAVAVCGAICGFGKVSGDRLKNHYPKGLRLLG